MLAMERQITDPNPVQFFRAGYTFLEEYDCECLVLWDKETDDSWEFQRQLNPFTAADKALGMDNFCIVRNAGLVVYGGIVYWEVHCNKLTLSLTDEAAEALNTVTKLVFTVSFKDAEALSCLASIFRGKK